MVVVGKGARELLGLGAGNSLEGRFVLLRVPDLPVVGRPASRSRAQDDAVEDQLPQQALLLDHARIGQELLQVNAHAPGVGGIRRTEIDQEYADARLPCCDRRCPAFDGNEPRHVVRGFARPTMLVKTALRF